MNIEIKQPLELLLEIIYLNGVLHDSKLPELKNLNELTNKIKENLRCVE